MSSADTSGANNDEGVPALPYSRRNVPPSPDARFFRMRWLSLPRSTGGFAALAFGLCGLFVAADLAGAQRAASEKTELVSRLVSSTLETVEADGVETAISSLARAIGDDIWLTVTDRDGAILGSHGAASLTALLPDVTTARSIAGPLGAVEAGLAQQTVLTPVLWRGLAALVLAGLVSLWAARRSSRADTAHRARALEAALALTSDAAIIWDRDQKLAAANESLSRDAVLAPALVRRGIPYARFLDGLRKTGDLSLIRSERTGRQLRLVLASGETWHMHEHLTEDGLLVTRLSNDRDRSRLMGEVARLRNRIGEMADEVQAQRVRGDAASRSKTLFLGQLSHSLRTPLNHIIGFADLLHHQSYGKLGDPRYIGYASNIKQSGEALLDMLANMLELAEFDSGHRVLAKEPVRLDELLDWADARYREQAARAGIGFFIERGEERVLIGDQHNLRRLIGNIVDNSLKFTPAGGSVTLAVWPTDDGVVLEFTDTGIGIAAETLAVLNTSFALGNESNGNGIAIARAIAELSGGQLQINSSPGIGTTVAVVLPARMAQAAGKGSRRVA